MLTFSLKPLQTKCSSVLHGSSFASPHPRSSVSTIAFKPDLDPAHIGFLGYIVKKLIRVGGDLSRTCTMTCLRILSLSGVLNNHSVSTSCCQCISLHIQTSSCCKLAMIKLCPAPSGPNLVQKFGLYIAAACPQLVPYTSFSLYNWVMGTQTRLT